MTFELDRQDWWDIGFAATLCALPLMAWHSTFLGSGWWIVGLIGVAAGLGVTVWVIGMGGGLDKAIAAAVVAYAVLCGPVAAGGIGGGMIADGIEGTARGWPLLVGTHPWIDASGQVLLPLLQLCLIGSALVVGLAMQSQSPTLPLLPAAGLLLLALFTARTEPVSVLVHGLVFGAIAVSWARQRSRLVEGTPLVGGGVMDQATTLLPAAGVLLVAALVAGLATRAVDLGDRTVLRSVAPAYDVAPLSTPLDEFIIYTEQADPVPGNVHDRPILSVRGAPKDTRIRFTTLDTYDGERWAPANDTDPHRADDRFLRVSSRIDNPASGERTQIGVGPLADWVGRWIPTAGDVEQIDFLPGAQTGAHGRVRFNPATRTAVSTGQGLIRQDVYTITTRVHDPEVSDDMVPSDDVDEELYAAAEFLDPAVEAWSAGATSRVDAVLQVASELKKAGRYSSDDQARYGPGHGEQRLGAGFVLEDPTVGNEEQYAAAMALMANRLRVPARVVVGAEVPPGGLVRGKHVSAWVELLGADGAWHVLDTDRFMSRRPPPDQQSGQQGGNDPGSGRTERIFPERTPDQQQPPEEQPQPPQQEQPKEQEQPEGAEDDDSSAGDDGFPLWPLVLLAGLLLAGAAAAVPVLKWWRRRRRRSADRVADRYVGAWSELLDRARDLGHRVPAGLTRPAEAGHLDRPKLTPLAQEADVRVFGADDPDPAEAAEFWSLVDAELTDLRDHAPLPRRLWAIFNPASLLR